VLRNVKPYNGFENAVYVNAFNTSEVIICLKDGCRIKASQATDIHPEYYINGETIDFMDDSVNVGNNNNNLMITNLIECKVNGSSGIRCTVVNGNDGDVYINSNYNKEKDNGIALSETDNQLIQCNAFSGCKAKSVTGTDINKHPLYFINFRNKATPKLLEALIRCTAIDSVCEIIKAEANEVYLNCNYLQKEKKPLIKCGKTNWSAVATAATKENKEYYLNAGEIDNDPLNYDIISCSIEETRNPPTETVICKCLESAELNVESGIGIYLNSNYNESGDNKQLIQCTSDNGCIGIRSESTTNDVEYYINAEAVDLNNAIIYCTNKHCEKQTPASVPVYFVGKGTNNDVDGLIECKEVKTTPNSINSSPGRKIGNTLTKCSMK